jgi:hypothetical protein
MQLPAPRDSQVGGTLWEAVVVVEEGGHPEVLALQLRRGCKGPAAPSRQRRHRPRSRWL